jgi:hypothetical protein
MCGEGKQRTYQNSQTDGACTNNDYEKGKLGFYHWFLVRDSSINSREYCKNRPHRTLYHYDWYILDLSIIAVIFFYFHTRLLREVIPNYPDNAKKIHLIQDFHSSAIRAGQLPIPLHSYTALMAVIMCHWYFPDSSSNRNVKIIWSI